MLGEIGANRIPIRQASPNVTETLEVKGAVVTGEAGRSHRTRGCGGLRAVIGGKAADGLPAGAGGICDHGSNWTPVQISDLFPRRSVRMAVASVVARRQRRHRRRVARCLAGAMSGR